MPLPDYKRPFDTEDFRGYFRWSAALTRRLGGKLYHACHREDLEEILDDRLLGLRSKWALQLPQHGKWEAPGVWTGLNYFTMGNRYGPFVISFPQAVLEGKNFMVFRRVGGRRRHFFVQYEAHIPIYSFGKNLWRSVNPNHYFEKASEGSIWDIVLTEPLSIDGVTIEPVDHPSCIPQKCKGAKRTVNRKILREIAATEFVKMLKESSAYDAFLSRYPCADGLNVALPELDDE